MHSTAELEDFAEKSLQSAEKALYKQDVFWAWKLVEISDNVWS